MSSKNFEKNYGIFCAHRYMVICLMLSVILISPFKSNAQWMPGLVGYGLGVNPMQGLWGYSSFINPLQYLGGYGFGMNPLQGPLGYGLFGSQMQYPIGYGIGVNPVREPITDNGLISKIKDLGGDKTAQISKSDELNGYYECIVISNEMVPPSIYNYPYQVDTNDVIGVVKCLLDTYEFVYVSKAEGMSNKFLVVSNDTSYMTTTSSTTIPYGGLMTYPYGAFYGNLNWLGGSGSMVSPSLNPLAYSGIGGFWGDITGYSAMQYLGQRINEGNLSPGLYYMFNDSIYGNPLLSLIIGNIPLYGRPTTIPSETSGTSLALSGELLRNCDFALFNPGLSYSMNLMTTPSQFLLHQLF